MSLHSNPSSGGDVSLMSPPSPTQVAGRRYSSCTFGGMRHVPASVLIVTGALLVNYLLAIRGGAAWMMGLLSLAGPFLIIWMVMDVLTDRAAPPRDLADDEEWGYVDRPDLRPRRQG